MYGINHSFPVAVAHRNCDVRLGAATLCPGDDDSRSIATRTTLEIAAHMDHGLLRSYFSTIYELPTAGGLLQGLARWRDLDRRQQAPRAAPDEVRDPHRLQPAIDVAPAQGERVSATRSCVTSWSWVVIGSSNASATKKSPRGCGANLPGSPWASIAKKPSRSAGCFGRTHRVLRSGTAESLVTDATLEDIGRPYPGNWRVR